MGKLERKLDLDLIARLEAGIKFDPKEITRQKPPRRSDSYRSARRNDVLRGNVRGVWQGVCAVYIPYRPKGQTVPKVYPYASKRQNTRFARRIMVLIAAE